MAWVNVPRDWERRRREIVEGRISREEIATLAIYDSERARGIAHTLEWQARMADIQARLDQVTRETSEAFAAMTASDPDGGCGSRNTP